MLFLLASVWAMLGATAQGSGPDAAQEHWPTRPLYFEINQGQAEGQAKFMARPPGANFLFSATRMAFSLNAGSGRGQEERGASASVQKMPATPSIIVEFAGANPQASIVASGEIQSRVHYLIGSDPSRWRREIPCFSRLQVSNLYSGIDLVYYGRQSSLEYDFVVGPGANPGAICLRIDGADRLDIEANGDLVFEVGSQRVRQHRPVIYQVINGERHEVAGGYRLCGPRAVEFELGAYDPGHTLIIDPVLSFSTYLGGSNSDTAWDVALDGNLNIYVAGETRSANLPTLNAFQTNYAGGFPNGFGDAFVAKYDYTGTNLLYLTYFGGSGNDGALGLAVDSSGNAYIAGYTDSTNLPLQNAIRGSISGSATNGVLYPYDAFVAKLSADGHNLIYSTYLGGNDQDQAIGIAVDSQGAAYVTGYTESTNFPVANPLNGGGSIHARADVFVTKISPSGANFVYSTFIGGSATDHGEGIAVDSVGTAFVTGYTASTNYPLLLAPTNYPFPSVTNAFQPFLAGGRDAFLTKINPSGTVAESTYIGGLGEDLGFRVAVDTAGNAYVTGSETASGFPVTPSGLNPGGVFKSLNGAGAWFAANAGLTHNAANSLALDPANPSVLYLGNGRGLWRSADAAASWQPVYDVAAVGRSVAVDPTNGSIVYGALENSVFKFSFTGTNWARSGTNLGALVNALLINPAVSSTLYAGTDIGVFRSTNSATNWVTARSGMGEELVFDLVALPGSTNTFYAGTASGVFRSTNSAGNWHALNNGLTNLFVQTLAIDPGTPSVIYAGTIQGLFRSTNFGSNWSVTALGPSNVTALAIDPAAPATVYAGTSFGVFKSGNNGASWTVVTNGLALRNISALAVNPAAPATVYAGTRGVAAFGGTDVFVTKFNASGSNQYSTVFGGLDLDQGWDLSVDANGNAFVAGATRSKNFPTNNTPEFLNATNNGFNDGFVSVINSNASAYLYSTYMGGSREDFAVGIEVDSLGNAYVVGDTSSTNFPVRFALDPGFNGTNDAFLLKISSPTPASPQLTVSRVGDTIQVAWRGPAAEYSLEGATSLQAPIGWTPVGPTPPIVNGWHTLTVGLANSQMFFRLHKPIP